MEDQEKIDAAKIGKMFVTGVSFTWYEGETKWEGGKSVKQPGHWRIGVTLCDKPTRYGNAQTMTLNVEQGIGQKLAEVLLPVVVADASRKAQQLAEDGKAMIEALGDRTLACLTNMPEEKS